MATIDDEGRRIPPPVTETEASQETSFSDQSGNEVDLSGKAFRYNPPMHAANLSKRVDFGNAKVKPGEFYDEDDAPTSYTEAWAKEGLNTLRLGRIIQHHISPGQASLLTHRWGFRFLYNPTTVSYMSSRNDSFVIDPRSTTNTVLSGVNQNFQNISFTVLLDRLPDVVSGIPDTTPYIPALSEEDQNGIKRWGTHWDMEALLRICNGEWNLTDRGKTANIGVLMPSNARLILGPGGNFFGFVSHVNWRDEMFSGDMVPVRTRLDIIFKRHVDMTAEQAENAWPGIADSSTTTPDGSGDGDSSSPDTGDGDSGGGDDRSSGNSRNAPVPGFNTVTTAYGKRGNWSGGYHKGDDYGLGGVKGQRVITTRKGTIKHLAFGSGGWGSWAGNHVVVKTGNVEHGYCHMRTLAGGLRLGAVIDVGTAVGEVGTTGRSTGNHLHYEERVGGSPRKPIWNNK